ncbi:MAG: hypothetical protein J0I41_00670 [Filimonas sp.]|nr:hypothetical protein [Filimonas sp.]
MPYKIIFLLSILFSSTIFSSLSYSFFSNKAKGIQYLQLPASESEKILVSFIVSQVFFYIAFMACYYATNSIMCTLYNSFSDFKAKGATPETLKYYKATLFDCIKDNEGWYSIIASFILSAVAHFGSLTFEKNAYVKTSLLIMPLAALILWLNYTIPHVLIGKEAMGRGLLYNTGVRVGDYQLQKLLKLPATWSNFLSYFVPLSLYFCFWIASYFKLKEKQV